MKKIKAKVINKHCLVCYKYQPTQSFNPSKKEVLSLICKRCITKMDEDRLLYHTQTYAGSMGLLEKADKYYSDKIDEAREQHLSVESLMVRMVEKELLQLDE